jgi:hypothetical protein
MLGNANITLTEFTTERYGEALWSEVMWTAGMPKDETLKGQAYPDKLTYRLVEIISTITKDDIPTILREFGRYQVKEILHRKYGSIRVFPDGSLSSILRQLPTYHTVLSLLSPTLRMPTYLIKPISEQRIDVYYKGDHLEDGPYVKGLLYGIIDLYSYGLNAEVVHTTKRSTTDEFDIFTIEW